MAAENARLRRENERLHGTGDSKKNAAHFYGGLGRFWDLPLDALMEAKVHGVRLIAPAAQASCCSDGENRSAGSGLIQALRGVPPFDGNRFPPFMWGGSHVAEADVAFIADWIDDGCLPDERGRNPLDFAIREVTRGQVIDLEFAVADADVRRYAYRDGEPRQRANLDCLTERELDALRDAFRRIYDLNKYEDDRRSYNNQALIHQNHCQHGWERFLPWHRAYLYEFEQNLQDFVKNITVPYWDWTMPQYRPHEPEKGWIIPTALREKETEDMIAALRPRPTLAQAQAFRRLVEPRQYFVSQHAFFCYVLNNYRLTPVGSCS